MIILRVQPGLEAAVALADIKLMAARFPGDEQLELRVGQRSIRLGEPWGYDASPQCLAALGEFGTVEEPPC